MSGNVHTLENPRVRFNWGFWDANSDQRHNRAKRDVADHFDRVYANGYFFGYAMAEKAFKGKTSEEAWNVWLDHVEETNPAEAGELAAAAEVVA